MLLELALRETFDDRLFCIEFLLSKLIILLDINSHNIYARSQGTQHSRHDKPVYLATPVENN